MGAASPARLPRPPALGPVGSRGGDLARRGRLSREARHVRARAEQSGQQPRNRQIGVERFPTQAVASPEDFDLRELRRRRVPGKVEPRSCTEKVRNGIFASAARAGHLSPLERPNSDFAQYSAGRTGRFARVLWALARRYPSPRITQPM